MDATRRFKRKAMLYGSAASLSIFALSFAPCAVWAQTNNMAKGADGAMSQDLQGAATPGTTSSSSEPSSIGSSGGAQLDTVVVTARRTSERLQDVPLSISAVTADQLTASHNEGLGDIAKLTPGLKFTGFLDTFNGNVTIRGLQQENVQNAIGNVGTFLDGIYLQRNYLVDTSIGDYGRIEVVKGPQSALYGQNTFAGAVNYVIRQPTDDYHVDAQATVGNGDLAEAKFGIGGPIIKGLLDARVYYAQSDFDGVIKNDFPGASGDSKYFGGHEWRNFSGGLKFTPTNRLTVNLFYYNLRREQYLQPFYTVDGDDPIDSLNCGASTKNTPSGKSLLCGTLPTNPASLRSGTGSVPSGLYYIPQPPTVTTTKVFKASADYRITDDLDLSYVFGDVHGSALEQATFATDDNFDGAKIISAQQESGTISYQSHEVRLAYNGSFPIKGEIGYLHSEASDDFVFGLNLAAADAPMVGKASDPDSFSNITVPFDAQITKYKIDSPFARLSYSFLGDRATLAAEVRYTHTSLSDDDLLAREGNPSLPLLKSSYGDVTPRFTAEYKIDRNDMVYASAARGAKAGGFNGYVAGTTTLTTAQQSFGEETNWTYELGYKSSLFQRHLVLDADLFYVNWHNKEEAVEPANYVPVTSQSAGVAPTIYEDVGNASSYGFELNAQYRATHNLSFNWAFSYQDPRFGANAKALAYSVLTVCDNIACKINGDIGGNEIAQVSKLTTDIGVNWHDYLPNGIRYEIGFDESYRGSQYVDDINAAEIAAFWLTDSHVELSKDQWTASLWVKNLFNKEYVDAAFDIPSIYQYNVNLGETRTFGLTLAYKY